MEELLSLTDIDWLQVAIGVVAAFLFFKFIVSSYEWLATKYGFETKKMRERREDHELLIKTAKNLAALQEKHKADDKKHENYENDIKSCLASFIAETKKENDALRAEIKVFADNRINDRQVSIERESKLNKRIDHMAEADKYRDEHIDALSSNLNKLTNMLVDKEISDIRWSILNFTAALSNGREYNSEAFNHVFSMYDKYERILEEHHMENGLINESMKYIREKYSEKLKGEL